MKRITLVFTMWALLVAYVPAQKSGTEADLSKEAQELFDQGQFLKAYPLYSQLLSLYPSNPDYNFGFGACAIFSDPDKTKAIKYLTIAQKKGETNPMVNYYLGKAYHLNYQFKDAVKSFETFVASTDAKTASKYNTQHEIETCQYGSNLLSNIKDVVVINKTEADKANFFRYMDLDGIGGKILTVPEELQSKEDKKHGQPGVIHYPGNSSTIYFSSYGKDDSNGKDIYKAQVLPDGKFSTPVALKGDVNTKYDEDYCFMHSDGKTLYFASKGHNTMGGYDIFKSVLDPATGNFGPAINLDFAINTPDDDIFFIADSLNKRAYFASGRTSDLDHLHVYNVMVEGMPLRVVYMKGEFMSEIDPEQKTARIAVKEQNTGRTVAENTSNSSTGNYVTFVPQAGDYVFNVKTENSPVEHTATVHVPQFDRPVAIRQEMKLTKENGVEKLVVNTFFEEILNEDLAALGADMLRQKAGLDVNTNAQELEKAAKANPESTPEIALSVEKTMNNAPLAAGFEAGVTVESVLTTMEADVKNIRQFVATSEEKTANTYSLATKKQKEADAALARAEQLRVEAGDATTDEGILKLRESVELTAKAVALQRDAKSAVVVAEAVKKYASSEVKRAEDLQANTNSLKTAQGSNNFDVAYTELLKEKQREIMLREGNGTPYSELLANAKRIDSDKRASEEKISQLRELEIKQVSELNTAENRLKNASKKADKISAETNVNKAKSALESTRRSIATESNTTAQISEKATSAYEVAELFQTVSKNAELGLSASDKVVLNDMQRNTVAMKIDELDSRILALQITDPRMMALITDATMEKTEGPHSVVEHNTTTEKTAAPKAFSTDTKTNNASAIKSRTDLTLASLDAKKPELAPARHMVVASSLARTDLQIASIKKKKAGELTADDQSQLAALTSLQSKLRSQLAEQPVSSNTDAETESKINETYSSVAPNYAGTVEAISSSQGSSVDHTAMMLDYKASLITDLKKERVMNAEQAMNSNDAETITTAAKRDQAIEAAIRSLQIDMNDSYALKASHQADVSAIVESDELTFSAKKQNLIDSNVEYVSILDNQEKQKKQELALTTDPTEKQAITSYLADIASEKKIANEKIAVYQEELKEIAANNSTNINSDFASTNSSTATTTDAASSNSASTEVSTAPEKNVPEVAANTTEQSGATNSTSTTTVEVTTGNAANTNNSTAENTTESSDGSEPTTIAITIESNGGSNVTTASNPTTENNASNTTKNVNPTSVNSTSLNNNSNASTEKSASTAPTKGADKINGNPPVNSQTAAMTAAEKTALAATKANRDSKKVKELFEAKSVSESIFVYENGSLDKLVAEHSTPTRKLQETETIREIQEQIFLVEAEIEIEENENRRRKLDHEAEEWYAKRSAMEMRNAPIIAEMTQEEFDQTLAETKMMNQANEEKINSRVMLREEMLKLFNEAQSEMDDAKSLRTSAGPIEDKIEKNDYYRRAYAKESHAIDLLKQIQKINENIDLFLAYNEEELTTLRYGNKQSLDALVVSKSEILANAAKAEGLVADPAYSSNSAASTTAETQTSAANNTANATDAAATTLASNTDATDTNASSGNTTEGTSTTATNDNTSTTSDDTAANTTGANTTRSAKSNNANRAATSNASSTSNGVNAPAFGPGSAGYIPDSEVGYYEEADAADYYYEFPQFLTRNLFVMTSKGVYSDAHPIPMNPEMPEGVYYKVQIGAFRNKIPQNLYDEFAPISGETVGNGITRYTAGFFLTFNTADQVKLDVRRMGYADAFVVAFRNGKRIPMYEAMGMTEKDFQAAIEKEYIHGDGGEAPKPKTEMTGNVEVQPTVEATKPAEAVATPATPAKDTNYMAEVKNAAPSTMVEATKGLFFTVQVGVYSKPVALGGIYNITPLNTELTANKKLRYTSGQYRNLQDAVNQRGVAREKGISDAFVTAYFNGEKISLSKADELLKEKGESILIQP